MHLAVERQNNYDKPPLTWDLLLVALMIKIIHLLMTFATLITFTQFTFTIPKSCHSKITPTQILTTQKLSFLQHCERSELKINSKICKKNLIFKTKISKKREKCDTNFWRENSNKAHFFRIVDIY